MNYKIKDLPIDERPREKLLKYGKENLSIEELIAIIINTGTKEKSSKDLAIEIIKNLNSYHDLNSIGVKELTKINGIKEVKAIKILASIELGRRLNSPNLKNKYKVTSAKDIYNYFRSRIMGLKQEKLYAIFLNNKNEIISYKVIFIGTQNMSVTHPREVFNEAIKESAIKIIIMHNHPTNDVTPSKADIEFTNTIKEAGDLLKIPVIDHIIISENNFFSFFDNALL